MSNVGKNLLIIEEAKLGKAIEEIIYNSASSDNTLSLGSACNMHCIFCSHQFNPPGLEVYRQPFLSLEEIDSLCDFLDPDRKIIIGESATRVIEGEPFLHPEIMTILHRLRERFPQTLIQITTNGSLLDENKIEQLVELQPLELNFSLNSASCLGRQRLMGDRCPERALKALELMGEKKIAFHGSIVAMPQVVGWEDLGLTIRKLADCGALTVRIFLPGFSKYRSPDWQFGSELQRELLVWLEKMRDKVAVPLLFEPPFITDLNAVVAGVLADSPALRAGIQRGDRIISVLEEKPLCRTDAFNKIKKLKNPGLKIVRNGKKYNKLIVKEANAASGLVFDYDLAPWLLQEWRDKKYAAVLICASSLAYSLLKEAVRFLSKEWEVIRTENAFFGGSICCAGLLTVADYQAAIDEYLKQNAPPEVIFLAARSFDRWGRDLLGQSYLLLEELYDIPVKLA